MSYAAPCPHDPLAQIRDDVFISRGSIRLNPLVRITRNMVVLRHNDELTLVNPIRLSATGEEELKRLGNIRRIVRLGAMHGIDDPWYVDQFGAELWSQPGGSIYPEPPIDVALDESTELPFPGAKLFMFRGTKEPECAMLLPASGSEPGLLLSCDGIQHYSDYSNNNFLARIMLPFIGFPKRMLVGPIWLKIMTPDGASLRDEFERLHALDFDALFSAHGTFKASGAKAAVRRAIDLAFD
ncbi:MAG: hypothetical protein AAF515_21415 [Pseudomonadota bacterium]